MPDSVTGSYGLLCSFVTKQKRLENTNALYLIFILLTYLNVEDIVGWAGLHILHPSHFVYSWDCVQRLHGRVQLAYGVYVECHGEIRYLVMGLGLQGVYEEVKVVGYLRYDVYEEMVSVDSLDIYGDRILLVRVFVKLHIYDVVSELGGEAYGLGAVAAVQCYGVVCLTESYRLSTWKREAAWASLVLLLGKLLGKIGAEVASGLVALYALHPFGLWQELRVCAYLDDITAVEHGAHGRQFAVYPGIFRVQSDVGMQFKCEIEGCRPFRQDYRFALRCEREDIVVIQ